jgi:hypothetical protein
VRLNDVAEPVDRPSPRVASRSRGMIPDDLATELHDPVEPRPTPLAIGQARQLHHCRYLIVSHETPS